MDFSKTINSEVAKNTNMYVLNRMWKLAYMERVGTNNPPDIPHLGFVNALGYTIFHKSVSFWRKIGMWKYPKSLTLVTLRRPYQFPHMIWKYKYKYQMTPISPWQKNNINQSLLTLFLPIYILLFLCILSLYMPTCNFTSYVMNPHRLGSQYS